ncbi:VanZ family protein [Caulobacter sp. 1776]|uniref:VanZ family protein n=1 Tax=Caulobacter sp. 1776 TaxID=3156420 RepID=UPI00339208A2
MFKPVHFVAAARLTLLVGSLTVAVLTLGPFQGAEQILGLSDKAAHAIAFGGLLAVSFLAFPRMRRNDLMIAALVLGAAVEVAQIIAHRDGNIPDWLADATGILTVYGAGMIETVRKMAREQGDLTFAQIAAMDRRRGRRRQATAFEPAAMEVSMKETGAVVSFAERAAHRFPAR